MDKSFGDNGALALPAINAPYVTILDAFECRQGGFLIATGVCQLSVISELRSYEIVLQKYTQDGLPDFTFGDDGMVTIPVDEYVHNLETHIIRETVDSKIVIAIEFSTSSKIKLIRLLSDGSPDISFSQPVLEMNMTALTDLAISDDNKIWLLAEKTIMTLWTQSVFRFLPDGTLDSSWAVDGERDVAELMDSTATSVYYRNIFLTSSGNIYLCGGQYYNDPYDGGLYIEWPLIARLKPDASPDSTFNDCGYKVLEPDKNDVLFEEFHLGGDNRIFMFQITVFENIYKSDSSRVFCIKENGSFDSSYGENGIFKYQESVVSEQNFSALTKNNELLIAGATKNGTDNNYCLHKISSDGKIDLSFGNLGYAEKSFSDESDIAWYPIATSSGKILIVGYSFNDGNFAITTVMCDSLGNYQSGFGNNGLVQFFPQTKQLYTPGFTAITVSKDSEIYGAFERFGFAHCGTSVVKFKSTGEFDFSYGNNGTADLYVGMNYGSITSLKVQPDGKLLAAGAFRDIWGYQSWLAITRFHSGGNVDSTFGTKGRAVLDFQLADQPIYWPYAYVNDMVLLDDGKILVSTSYRLNDYVLRRTFWETTIFCFTETGKLDSSFGVNGRLTGIESFSRLCGLPGGKFYAAGVSVTPQPPYVSTIFLLRFNRDGSPDASFNNGNRAEVIYNGSISQLHQLNMSSSSGFITISANIFDNVAELLMYVFDTSGHLTPGFAADGKALVSLPYFPKQVVLLPSGKYIVSFHGTAQIKSNGVQDYAYGRNGLALLESQDSHVIRTLNVDEKGRILITGKTNDTTKIYVYQSTYSPPSSYGFTGNGNWSNPANWFNNQIPPNPIPAGTNVVLAPTSGLCIIDVNLTVEKGAVIMVPKGVTLRVAANITLPEVETDCLW